MRNYFRLVYYLRDMTRHANSKPADLREYQNKRLRKLVKYAYDNVPFYKQKFSEIGIQPGDIANVQDLKKLPIIRKQELRNNPQVISREFNVEELQMLSTSGSSGQPLKIYINGIEDDYRKAKHLLANILCGQKPRDRYVAITAPSHFKEVPRFLRAIRVFDRDFVSVFDDVETQISKIEKIQPNILAGYASSLLVLAKEVEKRRIETIKPRFILSGAELLDDFSRHAIEEAFDAPVYDQYAIMEFDRIAWQCRAKSHYHMDEYALITQFVDQDGEEVSEGERGEIVCTSLFNFAMPFIRYWVGDVGIPSKDECPCGLGLPLMKVIEGRKDSLLTLPDGRLLSPRTFTVAMNMFKSIREIDQFRVIQRRVDHFTLQINKRNGDTDEAKMGNDLVGHFEKMLNVSKKEITFDVEFWDKIPVDKTGKLSAVVSEVNK